ncbi:MAG: hypothetical protein SPJ59_03120 [Peptoniphilaceae bacterium]|nr:hypothetical protein [Peptoniphilaceae bacterium]
MMRKIYLCSLLFLLVLAGCIPQEKEGIDINKSIAAPANTTLSIEGTWEITGVKKPSDTTKKVDAYNVGDRLYIDSTLAAIGTNYSLNPSYSAKYVYLKNYLSIFYADAAQYNVADDKQVPIYMIRDNDLFSLDIIQTDREKILFYYESVLYTLERVNEVVPDEVHVQYATFEQAKKKKDPESGSDFENLTTMIGVRESVVNDYGYKEFRYSTYLIYEIGNAERPLVYRVDSLVIPNEENELWNLKYEALEPDEDRQLMHARYTYSDADETKKSTQEVFEDNEQRGVSFVHNDVVSFNRPGEIPPTLEAAKKYDIYLLSQLSKQKPLSVTDLAGETENVAFRQQISAQKALIDPDGLIADDEYIIDNTNIGIVRQNLQWIFVTSMNWRIGNQGYPTRIPLDLVTKRNLFQPSRDPISWTRVRNKVPYASTASESPKKDRIFIKTEDEIQYYKEIGGGVSSRSLLNIQLGSESQIVMIEYYQGASASQMKEKFLKEDLSQPQILYSNELGRGN